MITGCLWGFPECSDRSDILEYNSCYIMDDVKHYKAEQTWVTGDEAAGGAAAHTHNTIRHNLSPQAAPHLCVTKYN